jgi:deazaflavin-dependent oxidoreductase (nitroreductase family)
MADQRKLEIPARGTRGAWTPGGIVMRIFKPLMNAQVSRYRKASGPTPPVMMGFPTVLLTTVGAKTGHEHTHVLGGFADGDDAWLVVASNSGSAAHPHWFVNLAKNPDQVWLEVGNQRIKVRCALLKDGERETALAKIAGIAKRYAGYEKKTDREIPIIRLTREVVA